LSEEASVSVWNDPPGGFHPVSTPDYLPRRQLAAIQLQRLQSVVARAYDRVPLFKSRMAERKLSPASIGSLADIAKLPFTVKTDLDTYPFGLFASPMEIVRLHASSGTTGKPIVVAYTQADLDVWTEVMVRSFAACGLHRGDVIQNAYGTVCSPAALGHITARRLSERPSSRYQAATRNAS
jgi:Coenzyme F390 synthetase